MFRDGTIINHKREIRVACETWDTLRCIDSNDKYLGFLHIFWINYFSLVDCGNGYSKFSPDFSLLDSLHWDRDIFLQEIMSTNESQSFKFTAMFWKCQN